LRQTDTTTGFKSIFTVLQPIALTSLDISCNYLTPADAEALYTWCSRAFDVQRLTLANCGGIEFESLLPALANNQDLQVSLASLDLSWMNLSHVVDQLTQALCSLHSLRTIVLDGCGFAQQQLVEIVSVIIRNPNLRDVCLCLRDLGITASDWPVLARLFERGNQDGWRRVGTIRELHLDRNPLKTVGVELVCQSMALYGPLRVLSLDQNLVNEVLSTEDDFASLAARSMVRSFVRLFVRLMAEILFDVYIFFLLGDVTDENFETNS
jgi:Ran GTPase-activating protein (RanGAP) involved in mRNA processing and transport